MDSSEPGPASPRGELHDVDFDELLREVLTRVDGVLDEQARLRLLLDAVVAMAADLNLDGVLARILTVASSLVDARYAALGVLDSGPRRRLRTFVHHGMTSVQVEEIGDLPTGHGLLGLIIDHPEPVRSRDIADHPASYGFPAHHPPMTSFLGVPIRIRGQVFGNLYLTEKTGGADFTTQDESIVVALAAAAGVVIENARLYDQVSQREHWLTATAEIIAKLADTAADDALQTVVDRAREVSGADVAWILAGTAADSLELHAVSGAPADLDTMRTLSMQKSLAADVVRSGTTVTVGDLAADPRVLDPSSTRGWPQLGPAIVVPLGSGRGMDGVLALAWTPARSEDYHAVDASLPASFAEQAALAIHVRQARADQQRLAVYEDRDRIGRDLHDLVIQRLFAVGLSLQGMARLSDHPDLGARLSTAVDDLDDTIRDIRRTIFALGSLDDSGDVQSEVTRLVDRAAATMKFRPTLEFQGPVRSVVGPDVVPDLLAVLGEALSNATRHAGATSVRVVLTVGDRIELVVDDDGRGMPDSVVEGGLRNMRQRAEKHGGTLTLTPSGVRGTTLTWSVPLGPGPSA